MCDVGSRSIHSVGQNEERTIVSITADGQLLELDRPLTYEHYGGRPATFAGSPLTGACGV